MAELKTEDRQVVVQRTVRIYDMDANPRVVNQRVLKDGDHYCITADSFYSLKPKSVLANPSAQRRGATT